MLQVQIMQLGVQDGQDLNLTTYIIKKAGYRPAFFMFTK